MCCSVCFVFTHDRFNFRGEVCCGQRLRCPLSDWPGRARQAGHVTRPCWLLGQAGGRAGRAVAGESWSRVVPWQYKV